MAFTYLCRECGATIAKLTLDNPFYNMPKVAEFVKQILAGNVSCPGCGRVIGFSDVERQSVEVKEEKKPIVRMK